MWHRRDETTCQPSLPFWAKLSLPAILLLALEIALLYNLSHWWGYVKLLVSRAVRY